MKKKKEEEEEKGKAVARRETCKSRRTDLFTTELSGILPFSRLVQEAAPIMTVPPKGSVLGNEATKRRPRRYLFFALLAQITSTFFPFLYSFCGSASCFQLNVPFVFATGGRIQATESERTTYFLKPARPDVLFMFGGETKSQMTVLSEIKAGARAS